MRAYRPSLLEAAGDRAMALLARDDRFRARLLRFIDALAGLEGDRRGTRVQRLLREYLDADFPGLPRPLRALLPVARSEVWPAPLVAWTARTAAKAIASRFIAAGGGYGALRALTYLRAHGRYPSFDVLGEYVASEREADAYRDQYLELLRVLARAPEAGHRTPAGAHVLQVSVKLSSLTADFNPVDPAGTLVRVAPRLGAIVESARARGIGVTLDMERYETRDLVQHIFLETFARGARFGDWDGIGVVLQAYLRDADRQGEELVRFAAARGVPFDVRLVKGAYWDYETVVAQANGWPSPVWEAKADTDACFERLAARLLDAHPSLRLAVASHNLRSHAHAEALREGLGLPAGALEHQALFRTAEGITRALAATGWPVRDYVPLGDLLPGMAYLVRRILENSSQAGFLLQSRAGQPVAQLLAPPAIGDRLNGATPATGRAEGDVCLAPMEMPDTSARRPDAIDPVGARHASPSALYATPTAMPDPPPSSPTLPSSAAHVSAHPPGPAAPAIRHFRNHPPKRLFLADQRAQFQAALDAVRAELGRDYPLRLGGETVRTDDRTPVRDPSHPDGTPVGFVHNAGPAHVARALDLATGTAPAWAARPVAERAATLRRAADLLAERRDATAAWIVHEGAKAWPEALADVDEAIDFLRYYALLADSLAPRWEPRESERRTPHAARRTGYRPRGVVAVIPPWNFPLAIPCGMTAAALVAGNAAILKPAEQTPLIAGRLVALLHEAGVPEDALIWLPGPGETVGAALVASSLVDMVAFTGSRAVGTMIHREGTRVLSARGGLRATVAELGGKNAILVFPDADLDEAVIDILRSAFGHSNQKCSAASRALVHQSVYPRLRERLVEGARSLPRGPADDPGALITPLIDAEARDRVLRAGALARREGRVLLDELDPPVGDGTLLGPEIVEITATKAATAATTQEEIFGPILALIPFKDEREAVRIANGTRYALTGGVFSRSPGVVERMARALDVGNLYVNRPITGARVGVEPFGGHRLSGTGPKAGGEDYLWAFVTRRDGLRPGDAMPHGAARLPDGIPAPWIDLAPAERAAVVRRALDLLDGEWRDRSHDATPGSSAAGSADLAILRTLLDAMPEVATPEATVPLPGQQTETRWDTPRGCGLVLVDAGAPDESLLALVVAPLLAGNGVVVLPDADRRPLAELLLAALHRAGVPQASASLAPPDLDLAAALALPAVTFAALDANEGESRAVHRLLGEADAATEPPYLSALITLADGPGPRDPGFLRRFALPKTVAIQTLHLGAELELLAGAGE